MKELELNLRILIDALRGDNIRWKGKEDTTKETVFEHMFKQNIIVLIMLAIENEADNPFGLNYFDILRCSILHYIGESVHGDIPLWQKKKQMI